MNHQLITILWGLHNNFRSVDMLCNKINQEGDVPYFTKCYGCICDDCLLEEKDNSNYTSVLLSINVKVLT